MRSIVSVDVNTKVKDAAKIMVQKAIGSLIINKEGEPFGMVTDMDLVDKIVAAGADPSRVTVGEIMTVPLATIDVDASLVDASRRMVEKQVKRLAVSESGRIVGIVSQTDIVREITDLEKLAKFGIA